MSARSGALSLGRTFALTFALGSAACAGTKPAPVTPPPPTPMAAKPAPPPPEPGTTIRAEIEPLAVACAPNQAETCNALDDDCNGIIDDGCGYASGGLQVTVGWDTAADIDLYVTDPSGEVIYYNERHERSSIGGHLDHDARGDCRREQNHTRIENAHWPAPAPSGTYRIELHYFSPCSNSKQTRAVVSVAYGGKLLGSYAYELKPEQRVEALSLDVR